MCRTCPIFGSKLKFLSFLGNYNFHPKIGHVLHTHFLGNPVNSNLGSLRNKFHQRRILHHHRLVLHKLHHFRSLEKMAKLRVFPQIWAPPVFFLSAKAHVLHTRIDYLSIAPNKKFTPRLCKTSLAPPNCSFGADFGPSKN